MISIQQQRGGVLTSLWQRLPAATDPKSWVIYCGIATIASIIIGTGLVVTHFRDRALEQSALELDNTSRLLAQQFDRQFEELNGAERFIAAFLERRQFLSANFLKLLATDDFQAILDEKAVDFVGRPSRISLFDWRGDLIVSSRADRPPPANIAARAYFKAIERQTRANIASPQIGLINEGPDNTKSVVLARGIYTADKRLLGVVARAVPTDELERALSSAALKDRTILLVTDDGEIAARHPGIAAENDLYSLAATVPPRALSATSATANDIRTTGRRYIVSAHRLARYPATVLAATMTKTALSNWRTETWTLVVVDGLAALVIGSMLISVIRQLKEQTRRLDVAVNNMPQALLLFDSQNRLIVKNRRYSDMFDNSDHLVVGRRFDDIIANCRYDKGRKASIEIYRESVREALRQGSRTQRTLTTVDGRALQIVNEGLSEGGWVSTIEDVTERRRTEELTIRLAQFDALTGLPNRSSFLERLRLELCKQSAENVLAVLMLDMDEFKTVNDTLGHHIGDQLLRSVAVKLRSCIKAGEFVARLGGDEFALMTRVSDADAALDLVQRVFDSIRCDHECGGHTLTINASIGIALAPDDGATCEAIIQSADLAMYAAKAQGKNSYRFFESNMETRARERLLLEAELRRALAKGQIEAYFQPIYDLHRKRIVTCEALARWQHPDRGIISPTTFIPIAEQSGLIGQLGESILRQACNEAAKWPNDVTIAVNVSPLQLKHHSFPLRLISALSDSGLAPHRLELEITEDVFIGDDEAALKMLHELRATGVRITLDDFGTGYSSLSYLLRFPFNKIKIDRCFVDRLRGQETSRAIVRGVIAMASELRMTVTAEGVESEEQRDILASLNCDQIQGYLIAAALTGRDIADLLGAAANQEDGRPERLRADRE